MKKTNYTHSNRLKTKVLSVLTLFMLFNPPAADLLRAETITGFDLTTLENPAIAVTISGRVTDETGSPLPGVTVNLKGTTIGAVTDTDGKYVVRVADDKLVAGGALVFTYTGYMPQEVAINGRTEININLAPSNNELGELVVIGYGTQNKKDLTGAVGTVNVNSVNKVPTNDITKAIQGQVAGVSVHSGGEPGAVPQIKIRGVSSFNNNNPLFIIDGVQSPVNDVPTSDIESVQILKDASAAAIYGSRAANGVVIITTKRGSEGKLHFDYDTYRGWQKIANRIDMANREEYQMLVNEASANADPVQPVKPANDPASPLFVDDVDTDWQKEAFKTGDILSHTLGVSGGTEAAKYNVSLNYYDHSGTVAGNGPSYTRYSFRVNTDFKQGRFKFGESIGYSKVDQNFMTFVHTGTNLGYIVNAIPTIPVYDESTIDGFSSASQTIHGSYTANAIGFNSLLDSKTDRYRMIGNAYGEYRIWDNLKYKLSLGYERTDWRDYSFTPVHDLGWFYVNNIAKLNDWRGSGYTGTIENTLSYDKIFGKHNLALLAGQSVLQSEISRISGHSEGFTQPYFPVLSNGTSGVTVTGYEEMNRLLSYFGRVIYSYNNKYLLTATIRRDASSRFSAQNRWGSFPSIAVGWKIHNEEFMQNQQLFSQLKFRASYGLLGNQEIPPYQYEALVNPYSHAVFSNQLAVGATQVEFATPDIKWESKESQNIGFDFGFMEDKLTFSAEYYRNTSKDMLLRVRIPESTGVYPWKSPYVNGASVRNSGFEFQANFNNNKGDLNYSIGANLSTLKNEVLSLGYGNRAVIGYGGITRTEVGGEVGALYGWVLDGIFQNQGEIDALNAASPIGRYQEVLTRPGDYRFKDINGRDDTGALTGLPDGKIDDDDRTFLGSAVPDLYFGFNFSVSYKGFDLSALASGASGNLVFNGIRASVEGGGGWDNYSKNMLNRWTPSNTETDVPRVVMFDPNKNGRASSRWLEDGSYLRLTNIQLGYSLPAAAYSKIRASKLRVYVSGQNLVTLTKYSGFDPDFGNDGLFDRAIDQGSYPNRAFTAYAGGLPNPRGIMVGLQVGF
jgi:TonB-dependent starch-binding outer membrane protein SusC